MYKELNSTFDLSDIDWNKCHVATFNSITMDICNLWNDGIRIINKIAEIVGVERGTVIRKLKLCSEQGLCDYKPYTSEWVTKRENAESLFVVSKLEKYMIV